MPDLPAHILTQHFHEVNGRSSKDLYAILELMMLQQMHGFADAWTIIIVIT